MTDSARRRFVKATLEDNLLETTSDLGDEEEEDNMESCSSFSLQQCIDEFRARRIRRNSAHVSEQRDEQQHQLQHEANNEVKVDALADADLISQNRSNKEHERKCKPCKNGFCYCFTSDSGDGGCGANVARGAAYKLSSARRSRKSESGQFAAHLQQPTMVSQKQKERRSAPASLRTNVPNKTTAEPVNQQSAPIRSEFSQTNTAKRSLTAVSRLETSSHDAPLIHIIQELRDDCVISEVRVNKHKLKARKPVTESEAPHIAVKNATKRSPANKKCNSQDVLPSEAHKTSPKLIETLSGDSIPIARLEISSKSPRKKVGAGQLLQKRLSLSNIQYKPRDYKEPPRKPPRASTGSQAILTDCSLSSTSPSVREAERIVDEFLTKKGISVAKSSLNQPISNKTFKKRMSFPLTHTEEQLHVPTCPSLSDIEQTVESKARENNEKKRDQVIKDITLGWKEPKVSEMLNYDTNGNHKEFKSQAAQAEPQSIGWQIPPKLCLDTVDGAVRHNLASNLETKDTPVKRQFNGKRLKPTSNYKFGWSWTTAQKCPRSFLKQSKKKILKLVTPKKDNRERSKFQARKTPYRNVGIQTSLQDFACAEDGLSPPGSYHSAAVQTSTDVTPQYSTETNSRNNNNTSDSPRFDFTRKVNSPPRKSVPVLRNTQRKLDFPSNFCGAGGGVTENAPSFGSVRRQTAGSRTYRSYQTDLDQDVTLSKMGCILSKIRARLEASDEHAIRTFEEIEKREQHQQQLAGYDCPDSHGIRRRTDIVDVVHVKRTNHNRLAEQYEPIYSEIEEDSIHVSESPEFDNKTGIESSSSADVAVVTTAVDFEMLYAKVNKQRKKVTLNSNEGCSSGHMPLAQVLRESLPKAPMPERLSIVMEPSLSEDVSYSSPPLEDASSLDRSPSQSNLSHSQSLNNVRVREQHSPPKRNRNLSKSDLSLHRSEIFLENLCRSELIVKGDGIKERLEKIDNKNSNCAAVDSDAISYDVPLEMPNEAIDATTSMQMPKKFLTKQSTTDYVNVGQFSARLPIAIKSALNLNSTYRVSTQQVPRNSISCPVTPQKFNNTTGNLSLTQTNSQPNCLNESNYDLLNTTTRSVTESGTTTSRYKRLKHALQKSFRKSKNFVKYRRASLPTSELLTTTVAAKTVTVVDITENTLLRPETPQPTQMATSCLNLEELFQLDEAGSVTEQIARAVTICRQLPELESSREMVEAERLLLYSTLRHELCRLKTDAMTKSKQEETLEHRFSIHSMRLPVILETNLDGYFNYYFTITFECNGQIHSTQSTECRHGEVVFQNCDFEFLLQKSIKPSAEEQFINCNIFMLRLRKVSTSTTAANDEFTPLPSTPVSSASSLDDIKSRFRLYASFSLAASSFKPYKLLDNTLDEQPNEIVSLSAFNHCQVTLQWPSTASTSAENTSAASIIVIGNAVAQFRKFSFSGFLHVQDPFSLHNWNWRWCTLLGLQLQIWTDATSLAAAPVMTLNLADQVQTLPLTACSRELCARVRSFCVQCSTSKIDAEIATAAVFFAAENDVDLEQWLRQLNEVFKFIVDWMQ